MNALISAAALPDAVPPAWRVVTKFGYFTCLAAAIGSVWAYTFVVRPALRTLGNDDAARVRSRIFSVCAGSAAALVAIAYFQLAARVARANESMSYGDALAPSAVVEFLTKPAKSGDWIASGVLISAQNLLILTLGALLIPLAFRRASSGPERIRRADRRLLWAVPISVLVSLVASVPTKAVSAEGILDKVMVQGHIVGGSLWVGGLLALALLASVRNHLSADAGRGWAVMWERFGVVALVSVGMVLISGAWLTWQEVGAPEQFFTTIFGRVLLAKIVFVAGLIAAGAYNQFVLMPKISRALRADGTERVFAYTLRHFPRVVVTEVLLGLGVLALVPFLNGSARAQAAGQEVDAPTAGAGLLALGAVLTVSLAASFVGTLKASAALGRLDDPREFA